MRVKKPVVLLILITVLTALLFSTASALPVQQVSTQRADALVLVNSESPAHLDFRTYIQPYLDNFGIPYTVMDISAESVGMAVAEYAVILVGHRQLDPDGVYLSSVEQGYISDAVSAGTGLVSFDNDLSADGSTPRYEFVDDVFGFGYEAPPIESDVRFTSVGNDSEIRINCWEDDHQDPVLPTIYYPDLPDPNDDAWGEFKWDGRDYPGVFSGKTETPGLIHFYDNSVPNGMYRLIANLYRMPDYRYFYGFEPGSPRDFYVDVTTGPIGDFAEFDLTTLVINDGTFDLYTDHAEVLVDRTGKSYGWAWLRLEPVGVRMSSSSPTMLFDGDGDGVFGEPDDDIAWLVDGVAEIAAVDATSGESVKISATDGADRSGSNSYTILPGELDHIEVAPADADVPAGAQQDFDATGYDQYGNQVAITPEWSTNAGTITAEGLLTADEALGCALWVEAAEADVVDTATVDVVGTFYQDTDGDGYGDLYVSAEDCAVPSGYVMDNTDCDDDDVDTYPGAVELCDGVDNNCDGQIDEGFDGDGDGYTVCSGDCDDADPAVNPGVEEIGNNGVDDNCDGTIVELWAMEYRYGEPVPGYRWDPFPYVFESWLEVRVENHGTEDVYNVTATISSAPANIAVVDGDVTFGDIPVGGSVWSPDTYTIRADVTVPYDPYEMLYWDIEYDDAQGVRHVIEDVPQFPPVE